MSANTVTVTYTAAQAITVTYVDSETVTATVGDAVTATVDVTGVAWPIQVGGATDHGALSGLADDDHTQYHNDTRGDARYYTQAQVDSSLAGKANTSHTHAASDITSGTLAVARGGTGLSSLGTAGQVPTVNSGATALEWADPAGGGGGMWSLITETTLGATATAVAFSSVTGTSYRVLRLRGIVRGASGALTTMRLYPNADTTAGNYQMARPFTNSSFVAWLSESAAGFRIGECGSDTDDAITHFVIEIHNERFSGQPMFAVSQDIYDWGYVDRVSRDDFYSKWTNPAEITALTLTCSGSGLKAGSMLWLEGIAR